MEEEGKVVDEMGGEVVLEREGLVVEAREEREGLVVEAREDQLHPSPSLAIARRASGVREADTMSQSYHEIFDTQPYRGEAREEETSPEESTPQVTAIAVTS